jgi:hypothetical protein
MVDHSVNDAVADGLRNNELCIGRAVQTQLAANVRKANARVAQVDLPKAGLDDVVA